MQNSRDVLTPDALAMLQRIAETGSFAAAARALNFVPSALTYRVRQIEDALDVLLFDRSSRHAKPTEAGAELLREGARLLAEVDAVANRVRRIATGWESQLTIALDSIIAKATVMELCSAFFALIPTPPTRIKLRDEALSGTLQSLISGQADLAIGVSLETAAYAGLQAKPLGRVKFVFAVAPHHALATLPEPLTDDVIQQCRAVAVADTVQRGSSITFGLLIGQDVFTVATMQAKLDAHLRGLGAGFLPEPIALPYIKAGRLVVKRVERPERLVQPSYAWRTTAKGDHGQALDWWLTQLESKATRAALLSSHRGV